MKRLFVGVAILIGVAFLAVVGITVLVPAERVKSEIISQVRSATGWNVRIDGTVDFSVLPSISLTADDVGVSGKAWADGVEFVAAERMSFGLALLPLLTGEVAVSRIRLQRPVFVLEIDRNGQTSWDPVETENPEAPPQSIEDAISQSAGEQPLPNSRHRRILRLRHCPCAISPFRRWRSSMDGWPGATAAAVRAKMSMRSGSRHPYPRSTARPGYRVPCNGVRKRFPSRQRSNNCGRFWKMPFPM